ncbi:hypothetical protein JOM56_014948 [Amanita muscaria]
MSHLETGSGAKHAAQKGASRPFELIPPVGTNYKTWGRWTLQFCMQHPRHRCLPLSHRRHLQLHAQDLDVWVWVCDSHNTSICPEEPAVPTPPPASPGASWPPHYRLPQGQLSVPQNPASRAPAPPVCQPRAVNTAPADNGEVQPVGSRQEEPEYPVPRPQTPVTQCTKPEPEPELEPEPEHQPAQHVHGGQGLVVVVLYKYEAAEDNEMSLVEGEYTEQIEKADEGWWHGLGPGGKCGLFPSNYVEIVEQPDVNFRLKRKLPNGYITDICQTLQTITKYRSAKVIEIEAASNDWWEGTRPDRCGLFPATNYVQIEE